MRSIQPEKMFFKGIFLKQNLLGFFSCLFVLLFSNILKTVMFSKVFNLQHQLFLVLFFSLSMAFLALMLFQLKFNILRWWLFGFVFCSIVLFTDVLPFSSWYLYLSILISFLYLLFTSYQYHKADEIYLKFNWKIVFRNGFQHQFFAIMILYVTIVFLGFIKVDYTMTRGLSLNNFVQSGITIWTNYNPKSGLNKSFDSFINDFVSKNSMLNNLQKQYSFLGVSSAKTIGDSIRSMFKTNFDGKTKLSQILVDYFNKSSQTIKTIVFGAFLWFILSIIGFFYFISKTLVYYFSYILITVLVWTKFFKFEEKPTVKQYLII